MGLSLDGSISLGELQRHGLQLDILVRKEKSSPTSKECKLELITGGGVRQRDPSWRGIPPRISQRQETSLRSELLHFGCITWGVKNPGTTDRLYIVFLTSCESVIMSIMGQIKTFWSTGCIHNGDSIRYIA